MTMVCDHIAASVLFAYRLANNGLTKSQLFWYELLRDAGRIAFPIFIILLIEGLVHSHDPKRYFFRLCLFTLISEIPFDLAFHRVWYYPAKQNVFWTLSIGFFVIWGMDSMKYELKKVRRRLKQKEPELISFLYLILLDAGLISAGALGALVLNTDYSYIGILAIVAAYLLRRFPLPQILSVCLLLRLQSEREWYSFLAVIPVLYYNGHRGKQMRYFFYIFYPAHLLVLYLIVRFMGLV